MLKLSLFEFIVRTIPESFVFIFCIIVYGKEKINKNKYIISSILLCLGVFLVRQLPINYGVHVVLNLIILAGLTNYICGIEIIKTMKACILVTVLSFLFEGLNVAVLSFIFKENFEMIIANSYLKTILGLPSLVFLFITGLIANKIKTNKIIK